MSRLALSDVAQMVGGHRVGDDRRFDGVSTDTRTLVADELFVALKGPNYDGHDYLGMAADRGAAAALVEAQDSYPLAVVEVEDTRLALGRLAKAWRLRCPARVIGITGSNGKTTLKEMIAAILARRGEVLATRGNLNNDIGVPLTLCRLRDEPFAVIEMGANHAGEIDYLTQLAAPDIAVLNNAGRAHLEGFGSLEGVARAKAEIINGLGPEGTFVLNADDRFAGLWRELAHGVSQCSFGVSAPADVSSPADSYRVVWTAGRFEARFEVCCEQGETEIGLQLAGEHNRMNALAAIAASLLAGATLDDAAAGLATLAPVPGRLRPVAGLNGARLIDDSYNANPESVIAALRVLAAAPGRRTLVLGDLAELGPDAAALHRQLGDSVNAAGIERLMTVGRLSAGAGEVFDGEHRHFSGRQSLIDVLGAELDADDTILVKGSRAARLDEVVEALRVREVAC
jgi:UDP-N-acetylmuramoyl-tripeptide--D-alanyl-D-alanine ligase